MKWTQVSENNFPQDWQNRHLRYLSDHYKLDTDLFELGYLGLKKINGTGFLPYNEIEYLDETPSPAPMSADSRNLFNRLKSFNPVKSQNIIIYENEISIIINALLSSHPQHPSGTLWVKVLTGFVSFIHKEGWSIFDKDLWENGETDETISTESLLKLFISQHPSEGKRKQLNLK